MTTPANKQNINTLRSVLFDTIADLRDKKNPMDVARANAICNAAKQLTDLARVEIDAQKLMQEPIALPFLSFEDDRHPGQIAIVNGEDDDEEFQNESVARVKSLHGEKIIRHVAGGTVTTHRMK